MFTRGGDGVFAMQVLVLVACAGAIGAAGPLDDPNSGPAGGTTNVRPAMSAPGELPPRIGRPPNYRPVRPIEPSPLESRPSPYVPGVREIIVPGAQRTLPAPGGYGLPQQVTPVSLSEVMRIDPRWAYYGRLGPNSYAIWNSWGLYVPGVDRRAPGFWYFPGSNSVVARQLDFKDFIRYSGSGPYWSERANSGVPDQAPYLHLNPNGSVTVTYSPSNWFAPGGYGQPPETQVVFDPLYPITDPNALLTLPPGAAPAPGTIAPIPPAPPTLLDQADDRFEARDYAGAADLYRQHLLLEPSDAWAMRAMAVSLFFAKRVDEAAAAMNRAYTLNPELANHPMPAEAFPRGLTQVRNAVGIATTYAERMRTDDAWLMVAVLLQSSGQPKGALKMVDRAAGAGLDPAVADKLRAALAKP